MLVRESRFVQEITYTKVVLNITLDTYYNFLVSLFFSAEQTEAVSYEEIQCSDRVSKYQAILKLGLSLPQTHIQYGIKKIQEHRKRVETIAWPQLEAMAENMVLEIRGIRGKFLTSPLLKQVTPSLYSFVLLHSKTRVIVFLHFNKSIKLGKAFNIVMW